MKDITIVPKLYDAILWYAAKPSRYPKAYRYNLGERIMSVFPVPELISSHTFNR